MNFKPGDKVHVTRYNGEDVDFYDNIKEYGNPHCFVLLNRNGWIYKPNTESYGINNLDYYTLATDEEDTEAPEVQHIKKENETELDDHYIIEVKEGLYVALVTSNGYLKLTKDIKKADVYEYKNAALKHAEFVDGRVLNLKRYVEAG